MLSEEDTPTPVPGRVSDEMMPSSVDSLEGDLGVELRGKNEDDLNDDPPAAEDLNALLGNNEVDEEDLSRPDSTSRKETSANLLRLLKKSSSKPSCRISEPRSVLHDDLEFSDEEENQNNANFDLEGLLSLSNMGKDTNEKPRTVEKNKRKSYLEHAISLDQKATNGKPRVQCSICSEILMKKSYTVHYRNMHKVKKSPWVSTKNQGESLMSGEDRPKPKPLRKHSWAPIKSSNGGAMKCEICGKGMSTSSNVCRHIKVGNFCNKIRLSNLIFNHPISLETQALQLSTPILYSIAEIA